MMTPPAWFISATGTDAGKTLITAALCHQTQVAGKGLRAIKPIASGVQPDDARSDVAVLAAAQRLPITTAQACQQLAYATFITPTAPDTAARQEQRPLVFERVLDFCRTYHAAAATPVLIEGAGGLYSPLTEHHSNADLAKALGLPVVLVAGTYLGAISHSIATLRAARADGIAVCALIINASPQTDAQTPEQVLDSLQRLAPDIVPSAIALVPRIVPTPAWQHAPDLLPVLGLGGTANPR